MRILRRYQALIVLSLFPLMLVILYVYNPVWRIFSDHGFMHQGLVYGLMNGDMPPESSILAANTILYPWAHHLLVAWIAAATNIPLSWIFAGLNVLALCVALFVAFQVGKSLDSKINTGLVAAILAVVSCNLLTRGPIFSVLSDILASSGFPYAIGEYKALVIAKFYNMNSNGLGIALTLCWIRLGTKFLREGGNAARVLGATVISSALIAFIYPVYILNVTITAAVLFALSLFPQFKDFRARAFTFGVASAVGILIAVPYLLVVSSGRTTSAFGFTHDIPWFLHKALMLVLGLSVISLLVLANRKIYVGLIRDHPPQWMFLLVFFAVSVAAWLIISQQGTEYKHFLIGTVVAGLLAAPAMSAIAEKSRVAALLMLGLFVSTFVSDWLDLMRVEKWPALQTVVEDGRMLRHSDRQQDHLYRWVMNNTHPNDAFIDDQLLMPVLGQRPLYFGIDWQTHELEKAKARTGKEVADGWEWRPEDLLAQQGYSRNVIAQRRQFTLDHLTKGVSSISKDRTLGERNIYLVARAPNLRRILREEPRRLRVYTGVAADIYLLGPTQAKTKGE